MALFRKRKKTIEDELDPAGIGSVQAAVGICILGLVGALMLTPLLDSGAQKPVTVANSGQGIDRTVTGSVTKKSGVKRYIIRRSVTHKNPNEPCILTERGSTFNDC